MQKGLARFDENWFQAFRTSAKRCCSAATRSWILGAFRILFVIISIIGVLWVSKPDAVEQPLEDLAAWDTIEELDRTLGRTRSINEVSESGRSYLICAAMRGRADMVRHFIDQGADLEMRCETGGDTALMLAAYWGHAEVVEILIEAGADALAVNDRGEDVLCQAAWCADPAVLRALLLAGVPARNPDAEVPARAVAEAQGHSEHLRLLPVG